MAFDYQGLANNPLFNFGINLLGQQGYSTDPKDAGLGRAIGNAWAMEQDRQRKQQSQQMENMGGATGYLVDRYMKSTGADYPTALYAVQTGMRQGLQYDNGAIKPMAGLPEAKGAIKFGEQSGTNQSNLQYQPQIERDKVLATIAPKTAEAFETSQATAKGKSTAEKESEISSLESKMPQLEATIQRLEELGKTATYTVIGQGVDIANREIGSQLGTTPRQGAVDRTAYIALVDNQILPLLRDTFGAQFTQKEGESLKTTLGDPNKSPEEKSAVLREFIAVKRATLESLKRSAGRPTTDGINLDAPNPNRVSIINAAGRRATIDIDELDQALANGWKQAQ